MSLTTPRPTKRSYRATEDPDRQELKRMDVMVSNYHWAIFDAIRDCGHTKREAVEMALELLLLLMIIQGKVPRSVQAEIIE